MQKNSLIERDLRHIWHPCSQMKDYQSFKPLEVIAANHAHLHLKDGRKIIDAISSWWCKSLGHNHPRLKQALHQQIEKFEHVILANTTNETIVQLSEKLAGLTSSLNKVLYASDGSCAVEMAMKMSLHARMIQGDEQRTKFIALENAYHGETTGALSVSDMGLYRAPYRSMLFNADFISHLPYVSNIKDELWNDAEKHWEKIIHQLEPLASVATAVIVEPVVQGAAGMKIHSQDFLRRLRLWTKKHGIHLIADEIMTGIGRTGKMLACEYADVEPDFLCLSKGLTSGWLPLSAMLTSQSIYDLFYDDYAAGKSFLHSHTHSGNVLAASVAVEVINIVQEEGLCARAMELGQVMHAHMQNIAMETKKLTNVRWIGGIVAADLVCDQPGRRYGYEIYKRATELGVLLRPLGNTVYWLPPLNVEWSVLDVIRDVTVAAIRDVG